MTVATYTTELRTLIEQPTQHMDNLTLDQKIEVGRVMLFDFDYPMFDNRYKRVFETNFIRHFYYREIGFETEELFKQRLQNWLNLNMGYFSKLFDSEMLKFDPFINSEVDVTHTRKSDRDSINDTLFGETTSRDLGETITSDEDTSKDTDKNVEGSTTYDTDFEGNVDTDTLGNTTYDTDFTGDKNTDTTGNTSYDTDYSGDKTIDTDRDVDTTGQTDGTSSGKSDTSESTTQDTSETSDKNTQSFSRQLHSDTPDGRLRLTLNEGEGTAEYVSDITENKEKGKEGVVTDTGTQTDSDTHTTSSDTTHSETTENEKTLENVTENEGYEKGETGTSSENKTENEITTKGEKGTSSEDKVEHETTTKGEAGTSTEDTGISEVGTRDEIVERVLRELGERNYDQNVTGNIKDLEDYVEHRVGKIGIQTYSKMLQEFRGTFMRIEVDIFREMEGRLFMLVY